VLVVVGAGPTGVCEQALALNLHIKGSQVSVPYGRAPIVALAQVAVPTVPSHCSPGSSMPLPHVSSEFTPGAVLDADEQPAESASTTPTPAASLPSNLNLERATSAEPLLVCESIFCDPFRFDILSL
jgi:hypothetical protein